MHDSDIKIFNQFVGKVIKSAEIGEAADPEYSWRSNSEGLILTFEDDTKLAIVDGGQSCCEHRYTTTDDNLSELVGQKLSSFALKECDEVVDDYDVHEMMFLEVWTDKGFVTLVTHNEHNGYYGGFSINCIAPK